MHHSHVHLYPPTVSKFFVSENYKRIEDLKAALGLPDPERLQDQVVIFPVNHNQRHWTVLVWDRGNVLQWARPGVYVKHA